MKAIVYKLHNTGYMTRELSCGPKIQTKRSLCGEIKYTVKVIITELYFEAMETNRDPEKLSNFELECGLVS